MPDHVSLWGLRLKICQNFDQWANVRPVHFHPGVVSPLRKADETRLDWVVVRENSEGEYAGLGGRNLAGRGPGNEVALQTALFTEKGCERIMRFAFDLWAYDDVAAQADAILQRLEDGTMPCDGAWPAERVAVFRRWIEAGKPASKGD